MHLHSCTLTATHTHLSSHTKSHGNERAPQIHTPVEPVGENLLGDHKEADRVFDLCVPCSPGARKQPYATNMRARATEADVSAPVDAHTCMHDATNPHAH